MVKQFSGHLEASETTPERQLALDSHIRARIKDELERLKGEEEDVRKEIELALEKENLDRETSMANDDDGDRTSSSIILGDMHEIRSRIEKYPSRINGDGAEVDGNAVVECYK